MRHTLTAILLLAMLVAPACAPKAAPPVAELSDAELEASAQTLVGLLSDSQDKSAEVVKMFSPQMAKSFPVEAIKEVWPGLVSQLGAYLGQGNARVGEESDYKTVHIACYFEKGNVVCKVVFDKSGGVAGLWFLPASSSGAVEYSPPEYADTGAFTEVEVSVGQGEWQLPGVLTLPKGDGPFPAVVLVHGSGPNDKDETVGANKPFKDLAWGLASKGVAVLRYEKRTREHQTKMAQLTASITVQQETVEDAVSAVLLLTSDDLLRSAGLSEPKSRIDPDRIFLLGHSLGGMLAPRIATALGTGGGPGSSGQAGVSVPGGGPGSSSLAGVIMMAGNARSLPDLVEEQLNYLASVDGSISADEASQIASAKAACDKIRSGQIKENEVILGAGRAYWADLMDYDPVETAKTLDLPFLILQGERDYQVTMTDFGLWQDALGERDESNVTFKSYPALNHLFIAGTGKSLPAEYEVPGNVAKEVVDDIAAWIWDR